MKKGFTLIELAITVIIVVVIATVATLNLGSFRRKADLDSTTKRIGALLREAQGDSMAQKQQSAWGVHFDNTNPPSAFYALFSTTNNAYASSSEAGRYLLPSDICYVTSTLAAGSSLNVIFKNLTGMPSAAASVSLQLGGCGTASTTVGAPSVVQNSSGKIFFDDFSRTNL